MPIFAFITEGITDRAVLENLLEGLCERGGLGEAFFNPLQPLRDATDESLQGTFGGWERVFEYFSRLELMIQALENNDFIVVQIDTDQGDHVNFGVPLTENGVDRPQAVLVSDTIAKFINLIDKKQYLNIRNKIIFAISVHSIECWILTQYSLGSFRVPQKNCFRRLETALSKKGSSLTKDYHCYLSISSPLKKKNKLRDSMGRSESLSMFVQNVRRVVG